MTPCELAFIRLSALSDVYFGHASAAHAVVVAAVRATEIEMLDPLLGPAPRVSLIETFADAWRTAGQEALILTASFFPESRPLGR